jgi:hypothetical protein
VPVLRVQAVDHRSNRVIFEPVQGVDVSSIIDAFDDIVVPAWFQNKTRLRFQEFCRKHDISPRMSFNYVMDVNTGQFYLFDPF